MHTKKGVPDGRTRTIRQLGICRKCFFQNDDSLALITGNRPTCPADRGESKQKKDKAMTEEEKKQAIQESELDGKIEIEFRKRGIGVQVDAKPYQVVIAAITLLNQAITKDQCDSVINRMELAVPLSDLIKTLKDKNIDKKENNNKENTCQKKH